MGAGFSNIGSSKVTIFIIGRRLTQVRFNSHPLQRESIKEIDEYLL